MRTCIVHRERALACFSIPYFCLLDEDRAALVAGLEGKDQAALLQTSAGVPIRNGQTLRLPIPETGARFFVAAYLGGRNVISDEFVIPAGSEDVSFTIFTEYDGCRRLDVRVELT
jgi:hypothetical protein